MTSPPSARPRHAKVRTGPALHLQAVLLSGSSAITSAVNYAFSILVVHLLATADYVAYASVQSLLLLLGSGGMAAIPWAVARHVATGGSAHGVPAALGFGLRASLVQGVLFMAITFAVVAPVSGTRLALATAVAALSLSLVAAPVGVLQGQERIARLSALRLVETAVRVIVSVVLVVLVATPVAPVAGFVVGSCALLVLGLHTSRHHLRAALRSRRSQRGLLRHSLLLGTAQLALAALAVVDTVVVASSALSASHAQDYQVAALLGRVPLYIGTAVALTYFARLSATTEESARRAHFGAAHRLTVLLAGGVALVTATAPTALLDLVSAGRGAEVAGLLPLTAAAGLAVAVATASAMDWQARERHRALFARLLPVAGAQLVVLLLAGTTGSATVFAVAQLTVLVVAALALLPSAARTPRAARLAVALGAIVSAGVLVRLLPATAGLWTWLLLVVLVVSAIPALVLARRGTRGQEAHVPAISSAPSAV